MKAASNMPGNHKIEGTRGVGIGEYRKEWHWLRMKMSYCRQAKWA